MPTFAYAAGAAVPPKGPVDLPTLDLGWSSDPSHYLPERGLVDAVNVALLLQQPLLLTGEPGTGKTQLAASIAWQLGLPNQLTFETKSTSSARDLFYTFDNLGRFHAAQRGGPLADPRNFITYNALGLAILRANDPALIKPFVADGVDLGPPGRSVVLIDEVDKAPRDFPNDILNEIDRLFFRVPELQNATISADARRRPIVILTSNSEKALPEAFLRRCIFYHLAFPDDARLEEIVLRRVRGVGKRDGAFLTQMLAVLDRLRAEECGMRKRPGMAELLNWATALVQFGATPDKGLREQAALALRTLGTLGKTADDQERVVRTFKAWASGA